MVCLSPIITQIKVNNLIIDRCSPCPLLLTAGSPPSIFLHFANSCSPLRAAHPWKGRATPPPTFPGSAHWLLSGPTIAEQYGRPCPNTGIRFLPLNWSAALIPVNLVLYIYLLSGLLNPLLQTESSLFYELYLTQKISDSLSWAWTSSVTTCNREKMT